MSGRPDHDSHNDLVCIEEASEEELGAKARKRPASTECRGRWRAPKHANSTEAVCVVVSDYKR